jgi:hypothetical protein
MKEDKAIKVSDETYNLILKIKKETRLPIKYIVEKAIEFLSRKGK